MRQLGAVRSRCAGGLHSSGITLCSDLSDSGQAPEATVISATAVAASRFQRVWRTEVAADAGILSLLLGITTLLWTVSNWPTDLRRPRLQAAVAAARPPPSARVASLRPVARRRLSPHPVPHP